VTTFTSMLNKTLVVVGRTQTGEDGGGQPIWDDVTRGTIRGRVDPNGGRGQNVGEVVNGPDLNPIISDFTAITELPAGFSVLERDTLTDDSGAYEVLGVAELDGRLSTHHLEIKLRRIA